MDTDFLMYVIAIGGFCLVVLMLAALAEAIPAVARWLELRAIRRELRRGRTAKEIRAMRRAMR